MKCKSFEVSSFSGKVIIALLISYTMFWNLEDKFMYMLFKDEWQSLIINVKSVLGCYNE